MDVSSCKINRRLNAMLRDPITCDIPFEEMQGSFWFECLL